MENTKTPDTANSPAGQKWSNIMNTITVNGKTYTMTGDAEITYRSHINGMQCTCPDNWVALPLVDTDGNEYTAWYRIDEDTELDDIDYGEPEDITDEDGRLVYDREA